MNPDNNGPFSLSPSPLGGEREEWRGSLFRFKDAFAFGGVWGSPVMAGMREQNSGKSHLTGSRLSWPLSKYTVRTARAEAWGS